MKAPLIVTVALDYTERKKNKKIAKAKHRSATKTATVNQESLSMDEIRDWLKEKHQRDLDQSPKSKKSRVTGLNQKRDRSRKDRRRSDSSEAVSEE